MGYDYSTSPFNRENSGIIQELHDLGYDVKERNNRFYVEGVEVDITEPLWQAEARITKAKNAEKLAETPHNMAQNYHEQYEEVVEKIKETKEKDNFFKKMWHKSRKSYNGILAKNNAKKIDDIKDTSERELAIEYQASEADYYTLHRRASNSIFSLGIEGTDLALKGGEWELQEVYARRTASA